MTRFFAILLTTTLIATAADARSLKQVGWVEEVLLSDVGTVMKAKLDTGAKTSSIDSEVIDIRKTGEETKTSTGQTVVFSVKDENGTAKTFERPIARYVRIKLKGGGFVRRPVITMKFCVGGRSVEEEVNLANRENFIYPVLIGRNMMQHADLMVNPAAKFLTRPTCNRDD